MNIDKGFQLNSLQINSKLHSKTMTKNELDSMRSILNSVWILTEAQKIKCSKFFIRKSTVEKLYNLIDRSHDYLDYICLDSLSYRVNYINGSTSWMETLIDDKKQDTPVLISFRGSNM